MIGLYLMAMASSAWVCTYTASTSGRHIPSTEVFRNTAPHVYSGDIFKYDVTTDDDLGFVAINTLTSAFKGKALVAVQVIAIDKTTGDFTLTTLDTNHMAGTDLGHCIPSAR